MKRLENYYPYYCMDTDENENYIVTVYPTLEDKENRTNGRTYSAFITLNININDSECMRADIDGVTYYFC